MPIYHSRYRYHRGHLFVVGAVAAVTALSAGMAVGAHQGVHGSPATTTTTTPRASVTVIVADVPGSTDPRVTQANIHSTICVSGYTATVRPPVSYTSALKSKLLAAHHYTQPASAFELDHEVSLELGGAPRDPSNLWLEPYPRAKTVDLIENQLHVQVCAGSKTLAAAQAEIIQDKHTEG